MSVVYDRWGVTVHHGCNQDVLPTLPANSVDSIVTDPPAGVGFMGRSWDSDRGGREQWIAWLAGSMTEAKRVLKPGGYGLVWALPRTSHWTAMALEDAGFEVRDCVTHLFAGGSFPKSLDVGKAIDKAGGGSPADHGRVLRAARERAGWSRADVALRIGCKPQSVGDWEDGRARVLGEPREVCVPSPAYREKLADLLGYSTDERQVAGVGVRRSANPFEGGWGQVEYGPAATDAARRWQGWGTALAPKSEHWWLIRKPLAEGTVAANVLRWGVGGINIDGTRIPNDAPDGKTRERTGEATSSTRYAENGRDWHRTPGPRGGGANGRWPSNVLLSHDERCDGDEHAEACLVVELDRQSADADGASRFFPVFGWHEKASAAERPRVNGQSHNTVKAVDLMRWLVRLVTPPGGTVLDPFAGSGATGHAARAEGMKAVLIEEDEQSIGFIKARLDARPKTDAGVPQQRDDEPQDLLDLLGGDAS